MNDVHEITQNEIGTDGSPIINDDGSRMPETFDITMINPDDSKFMEDIVEGEPAAEEPTRTAEQTETKPTAVDNNAYNQLLDQHNKLLQALENPKIKEAISKALNQTAAPQQNPEPTTDDINFEDMTEADVSEAHSFMKYIQKKLVPVVEQMVQKRLQEAEAKFTKVIDPILTDRQKTVVTNTIEKLKADYPEDAALYLDGKSEHSKALMEVGRQFPHLTLEQGFLMARGKMARHDAQRGAQDIAEKKRAMSISSSAKAQSLSEKQPHPKSVYEAFEMAMKQLKN